MSILTKFIGDHKQFNIAELFSNSDGKTSGTAFCGIVVTTIGSMCFLLGCIDKMWISHTADIITQSIVFTGIGAGLMGVRKAIKEPDISISEPAPLIEDPVITDPPPTDPGATQSQ
jgi:hypothetical protein